MLAKMRNHSLAMTTLVMTTLCLGVAFGYPKVADYLSRPTDCQAYIYTHEDPVEVMAGTSACIPCNKLVADLKSKYKVKDTNISIVGLWSDSIFKIVKAPPQVEKTPLVVFYYNNGTKDYVNGYKNNHREVVLKHPAYGGKNLASREPSQKEMHLISYQGEDGFQLKGGAKVQTLKFEGDEIQEREDNYTPFVPELQTETPKPRRSEQVAQCGLAGQYAPYGAYTQNCAASSSVYYAPYATSCNGGVGGPVGGGGDYYTPPQISYSYGYNPYVQRMSAQRTYPVYASPSYGYQNYQPMGRRLVCGPDGCYYVP